MGPNTIEFVVDRRSPKRIAGETDTLLEFLDYLRESLIAKLDDLDNLAIRQSTVPTGTCLLGLIKHLTKVEIEWFQFAFIGRDVSVPTDEILVSDTAASALTDYQNAIQQSNDIMSRSLDLDHLCARPLHENEPVMSLRWLLIHMVEETARHAGHADILRENIDGRTGR